MFLVHEAFQIILEKTVPFRAKADVETVFLDLAHQRILAQDIIGALDFPYWDNSAMDGYAVCYGDFASWHDDHPLELEVVMEIPAGIAPAIALKPGQAARIFTGAMLPEGADTIVMQEHTQRQGQKVQILQKPECRAFVRHQGAYYQAGTPLLNQGLKIGAPELAVLATAQCHQVPVFRKPLVGLLSTGNELVAPDQPLNPGQIIDSNRYVLTSLVNQTGAIATPFPCVGDRLEDLKDAIAEAIASSDVVVSSGGVSVGDYDYVEQAITELGGTLHIQSVAIKPGKPLTFATFERRGRTILYFGLPGNPVSAPVGFWRFVRPALLKLSGLVKGYEPVFVQARSRQDLTLKGTRETYLWGNLLLENGRYEFELAQGSHSSGNLMNLAQTNGLGVMMCDRPLVKAGEFIAVMQI